MVGEKNRSQFIQPSSEGEGVRGFGKIVDMVCVGSMVPVHKEEYSREILCVDAVKRRAARFVCDDCSRCSSASGMLTLLGRQNLELHRKVKT